jgi:hypothetical protein
MGRQAVVFKITRDMCRDNETAHRDVPRPAAVRRSGLFQYGKSGARLNRSRAPDFPTSRQFVSPAGGSVYAAS